MLMLLLHTLLESIVSVISHALHMRTIIRMTHTCCPCRTFQTVTYATFLLTRICNVAWVWTRNEKKKMAIQLCKCMPKDIFRYSYNIMLLYIHTVYSIFHIRSQPCEIRHSKAAVVLNAWIWSTVGPQMNFTMSVPRVPIVHSLTKHSLLLHISHLQAKITCILIWL